jgi:DNA-directed RNA polymerase specialized sigma24 family protein
VTVIDLRVQRDAPSDNDLARALTGGNIDALDELYARYRFPCLAAARRVVDDIGQAEGIVQEVFLDLWAAPARYDSARASFRQYVVDKTKDRSLDAARADIASRAREEQFVRAVRALPDYSSRCTRSGENAGMHTETYSVASVGVE